VDLPEDGENVELFSVISQFVDKTPILILAGSNNVNIYQKCLRSGINGLVLKEKNAEVLFKAIERVHNGEFWFDRVSMRETIRELVNEKQMLFETPRISAHTILTEREKQVVELVCKGLKNKDIADKLFITETTIRHHLSSIFEKLKLTSRLELVIYSFKNNLVELPKIKEESFQNAKTANRLQ
jgi:DNA-binding NarL/FixJ family response regulator